MDIQYAQKMLFKVCMVLIIVGALNWFSVGAFGYNFVEKILGFRSPLSRFVYVLVGICAIGIMFYRDTYLPFLGETVMPCSAIPEHIPENADTEMSVKVEPGAKVVYWAAEPATEGLKYLNDYKKAYMKYMNMGCVKANEDGIATLFVRKPQPYRVPFLFKGQLEPHIHYRVCSDTGMMSRIYTINVSDGSVQ